jgi:hypothetical protein
VEANIASIYVTLDNGLGGTFSFPAAIGTGGTWSAPITVAGVPDGAYAVRVTATDLAASLTTVTASGQLTNATPPIVALGTTVTNDATPPLTGTIDDPTAAVVVTVCGADYPATNDGHGTWTLADNTLATLPDGTYRVMVEATNTLDIQGTCSALLVVDAAAPVITVHSLVTTSTSPALSGAVNDSGADVAVTVNSVTYAATNNGDGTWSLGAGAIAALTPGVYSVTATATNALGTVGTDTTSHELTIGTTQVVTFSSTITKIVYVDADGTTVTVTSSGGAVALSLTGVGTMVTATGKTRTVSATGGIVQADVNVPANTPKTTPSLTFTTNASGDAQTTINQINGSGNLKSLTGKAVTLAGGINMTGYIQTLTLHAIASNIQMGTFAGGVTVTADTIANSTIHTGVIAKLTATLSFENSTLDATTIGTAALTNVLNAAISAVSITKSLSLANVRDTNVNAATIGKVTMSSVRNTNLTAATIGAVALTNVQVNNGGTHFGVTATSKLTSLKLVQSGITLTWGKQFLTHILDFTVTA